MNPIAYIIQTEHYDDFDCSTYNVAVFLNERDAIDFLLNHNTTEFAGYEGDVPQFCIEVIGIGGINDFRDPSDELQAAVDAANERSYERSL